LDNSRACDLSKSLVRKLVALGGAETHFQSLTVAALDAEMLRQVRTGHLAEVPSECRRAHVP
jgi:hypothetical protein